MRREQRFEVARALARQSMNTQGPDLVRREGVSSSARVVAVTPPPACSPSGQTGRLLFATDYEPVVPNNGLFFAAPELGVAYGTPLQCDDHQKSDSAAQAHHAWIPLDVVKVSSVNTLPGGHLLKLGAQVSVHGMAAVATNSTRPSRWNHPTRRVQRVTPAPADAPPPPPMRCIPVTVASAVSMELLPTRMDDEVIPLITDVYDQMIKGTRGALIAAGVNPGSWAEDSDERSAASERLHENPNFTIAVTKAMKALCEPESAPQDHPRQTFALPALLLEQHFDDDALTCGSVPDDPMAMELDMRAGQLTLSTSGHWAMPVTLRGRIGGRAWVDDGARDLRIKGEDVAWAFDVVHSDHVRAACDALPTSPMSVIANRDRFRLDSGVMWATRYSLTVDVPALLRGGAGRKISREEAQRRVEEAAPGLERACSLADRLKNSGFACINTSPTTRLLPDPVQYYELLIGGPGVAAVYARELTGELCTSPVYALSPEASLPEAD